MRETDTNRSLEFGTASITGHNHHSILEVYRATLAIGQTSIIHDLQQCIEDLWMRLLNLVQQNDAVRATAHLLGQLATFVIADIPWRATEQTSYGADSLILADDTLAQILFQVAQILTFTLQHLAYRHTCPVLNNLGNLVRSDDQVCRILSLFTGFS